MWVWIQVFGVAYVNVYEIVLNICVCMHMLPIHCVYVYICTCARAIVSLGNCFKYIPV